MIRVEAFKDDPEYRELGPHAPSERNWRIQGLETSIYSTRQLAPP